MEKYNIINQNLIANKEHYFYSDFLGKNFIISFLNSREKNIYKLKFNKNYNFSNNDYFNIFQHNIISELFTDKSLNLKFTKLNFPNFINLQSKTHSKTKNQNKIFKKNLSVDLYYLLIEFLCLNKSNKSHSFRKKINLIQKKFEVTKEFLNNYDESSPKVVCKNIENYVVFGLILSIAHSRFKNISYLNSLLKINDIVCSVINKIDNDYFKVLFLINLMYENQCISLLLNKKNIKL